MDYNKESLKLHAKKQGKLAMTCKVSLRTKKDLALAYTPGVAEVCREISRDKANVNKYTCRCNTIAIVTDGSRVLGLGNVGPEAALPVMEGKAVLFKEFGGVDAFPICLNTQDAEEIIKIVKNIAPSFGGVNLEDIQSPKCFAIEERLKKEMDIPVFHDDQDGTAIAILAGLFNALKLVGKDIKTAKIILNGAGAAGNATAKILLFAGAENMIVFDSKGAIRQGRPEMDKYKEELAAHTNKGGHSGNLADALKGADVFIGLSVPKIVTKEMVGEMAKDAIVFALANPLPEITPEEAKKGGAKVVATGRSDYANQINNLLVFPGLFRGVLDAGIKEITMETEVAAARAIANMVPAKKLRPDYIVPSALDKKVGRVVAKEIKKMNGSQGINAINPCCHDTNKKINKERCSSCH